MRSVTSAGTVQEGGAGRQGQPAQGAAPANTPPRLAVRESGPWCGRRPSRLPCAGGRGGFAGPRRGCRVGLGKQEQPRGPRKAGPTERAEARMRRDRPVTHGRGGGGRRGPGPRGGAPPLQQAEWPETASSCARIGNSSERGNVNVHYFPWSPVQGPSVVTPLPGGSSAPQGPCPQGRNESGAGGGWAPRVTAVALPEQRQANSVTSGEWGHAQACLGPLDRCEVVTACSRGQPLALHSCLLSSYYAPGTEVHQAPRP